MLKKYQLHIFFAVYITIGLFLVPDYGVGWDEWIVRDNAQRNYKWATAVLTNSGATREAIFEGNIDEHGPAFQLMLLAVEILFQPESITELARLRHYTGFIAFAFLSLGFFKLLRAGGISTPLSILGWLVLVFYPRLFAHAMFNSKDPILMLLFIWLSYFLVQLFKTGQWKWHLLFGVVLGFTVDIRIVALVFLFPYAVYCGDQAFMKNQWKLVLPYAGLVLVTTIGTSLLAWPYLWSAPVETLIQQFQVITQVKQPNPTLFFGTFYAPGAAPRWYLPVYLFITIPGFLWVAMVFGITNRLQRLRKSGHTEVRANSLFWISCLLIALPLLASMVLKPVFYNGWRHFQFIYPFIVVLAIYGITAIVRVLKERFVVRFRGVGLWVVLVSLASFNLYLHPFGSTYFNLWMGDKLEERFECDYWGVNFVKGWEYLSLHTRGKQRVLVSDLPGRLNFELLPLQQQERFELVSTLEEADFLITNHNHFSDLSTPLWHTFYFGANRPALGEEIFRAGTPQATAIRVCRLNR